MKKMNQINKIVKFKKFKIIMLSVIVPLILLTLLTLWIVGTTSGLKAAFKIAEWVLPGQIHTAKLEGKMAGKMQINDIAYQSNLQKGISFKCQKILIVNHFPSLFKNTIHLPLLMIENAEINLPSLSHPIIIKKLQGLLKFKTPRRPEIIEINEISGSYAGEPIQGSLRVKIAEKIVEDFNLIFIKGNSQIKIVPTGENFSWQVDFQQKQDFSIKTNGTFSITDSFSKGNLKIHKGEAIIPLPANKFYESRFQGGEIYFHHQNIQQPPIQPSKSKKEIADLIVNFSFKESPGNQLFGHLLLPNFSSRSDLSSQPLRGEFQSQIQDMGIVYLLAPSISRLKGNLNLTGKFKGTLSSPELEFTTKLDNAIFSIPKNHITVKEVSAKLEGHIPGKLSLDGTGTLGGQPFFLHGKINSFLKETEKKRNNTQNNEFQFKGEHLRIYNTSNIHIMASPHLNLTMNDDRLNITGSVKIPEASIIMKDELTEQSQSTSNDVIFVGNTPKDDLIESLTIMPNIELQIEDEDKVHIKGFGLDAVVRGNINIQRRPDGIFIAAGRLTIKEGVYRLLGSPYHIHRGHLLFPPGTLLNDPVLDIRVAQKKPGFIAEKTEVGIYVQGMLQHPNFNFYSTDSSYSTGNFQNSEAISQKLGIGGKGGNQLFGLIITGNPFVEKLQAKLGLEEFTIQSMESHQMISTLGDYDTVLVVGKPLSKRLYLQFLQGLTEPLTLGRIKYFINPNLSVGLETSTVEDVGGDLSFTAER